MAETTTTILTIALIFLGVPILILSIMGRLRAARRRAQSSASFAADRQAYEARILKPDWESVERHLERPVPQALRELYTDRRVITACDLNYNEHDISTFLPLDEQAIAETRAWLGFHAVGVAMTDFGDAIYLRPGSIEPDRLYVTYHDGGDTTVFAESVAEMRAVLTTTRL